MDSMMPPGPATTTPRGYALVLVMVVLGLLSVGLAAMFNALGTSAKSTGAVIENRRLFYACDGTARGLVKVAKNYLLTTSPTADGLGAALCEGGGGGCAVGSDGRIVLDDDPLPSLRPEGYRVTSLSARSLNPPCTTNTDCGSGGQCFKGATSVKGVCRGVSGLPNGPFRGVPARQDEVLLSVEQQKGEHRCRVQQTLVFGKLSMFQFFVFSDSAYTDWQPGPKSAVRGRVHANGDVCLGGHSGFYLEFITAAGDINPMRSDRCRTPAAEGGDQIFVAARDNATFDVDGFAGTIDPLAADFQQLVEGDRGAAPSWKVHAQSKWARHLLDRAHDVERLKLPILGTPRAQNGLAADGTVQSNNDNLRFLLEPVRTASGVEDSPSVRAQKFADKASIRIIDGVWYVRRNDTDWPGLPIWSDHPGRYKTTASDGVVRDGLDVGQEDVFGAAPRPRRYSAYSLVAGYDGARPPVLTYGVLTSNGGRAVPGFRGAGGFGGFTPVAIANSPRELVEGTRHGFRNGHAQRRLAPGIAENAVSSPANVLPINIDVAALQQALASTEPNELGARLSALGVEFNGIIWVSSTWPGSQGGLGPADLPTLMAQGTVADPMQAAAVTGGQQAVPHALCSDSIAGAPWGGGALRVPGCVGGSRPNAVRIINARWVNFATSTQPALAGPPSLAGAVGQLPQGLTIATPLPLYLLGDQNLSANTTELDMGKPLAQWVPMLVAGDVVHVLSNAWRDEHAPWHRSFADSMFQRRATPTTLNVEVIAGWPVTRAGVYSGGIEDFPRVLEDWNAVTMTVRGSFVVGHNAVYERWPRVSGGNIANPPNRDWAFDSHLEDLSRQPPGAPIYDVTAVKSWQRH